MTTKYSTGYKTVRDIPKPKPLIPAPNLPLGPDGLLSYVQFRDILAAYNFRHDKDYGVHASKLMYQSYILGKPTPIVEQIMAEHRVDTALREKKREKEQPAAKPRRSSIESKL